MTKLLRTAKDIHPMLQSIYKFNKIIFINRSISIFNLDHLNLFSILKNISAVKTYSFIPYFFIRYNKTWRGIPKSRAALV